MKFVLHIQNTDPHGNTRIVNCTQVAKCTINYSKSYTPVLYYLNPPVVYSGIWTDFWFNPYNTMSLIKDLNSDDLPFVNAKIGDALVDFEDTVSFDTKFLSYNRNRIRGKVTDQPSSLKSNASIMFETGKTMEQSFEMQTCTFD
jgi:hypothetical protein